MFSLISEWEQKTKRLNDISRDHLVGQLNRCGWKAGGFPELPLLGPGSLRPLRLGGLSHLPSAGRRLRGSNLNLLLNADTFSSCSLEATKLGTDGGTQGNEEREAGGEIW